ncbi:UDP-N-acetylmuramate dehydrogenase [bacterium]|nr:UDP-N-acetylmuramate dehydrogenase [bacterium]
MINILEKVDLSLYTTFKIGGPAKYLVEVNDILDLFQIIDWNKKKKEKVLVIGGGSNMLISDDGFSGLVIVNNIKGIEETIGSNDNEVIITAKAGEDWDNFVKYTVEKGYWGLENLSYIPGTVGASPIQNIGAYGVEMKDSCVLVKAINIDTREEKTFSNKDCLFSYRSSIFKKELAGKYIITEVSFRLLKKSKARIEYGALKEKINKDIDIIKPRDVYKAVKEIRQEKLPEPEKFGNAGSFFKNPEVNKEKFEQLEEKFDDLKSYDLGNGMHKIPAGWMIEKAGWKGKNLGSAGVWKNQALILVNNGGASFSEVLELMNNIIEDVDKMFGIKLNPEVNIFK